MNPMQVRRLSRLQVVVIAVFSFAVIATQFSCIGRNRDVVAQGFVDYRSLRLEPKPTVLVFSALWCKPCRAEIESLNKATREFGGGLQVAGYLVEGENPGTQSKPDDLMEFKSSSGEAPIYKLEVDRGWEEFEKINSQINRRLPTLVFADSGGRVAAVIQRSLDFETELLPMLKALIKGEPVDTVNEELPPNPESLQMPVREWISRPGNQEGSDLYVNAKKSWRDGAIKHSFSTSSMPFEYGKITFLAATSRMPTDTPIKSVWGYRSSRGYCSLTVNFNPNGTAKSTAGFCQP